MAHMFKSLRISGFMESAACDGSDIADFILKEYVLWRNSGDGDIHLDLELERLS